MDLEPLPFRSGLDSYEKQARNLFAAYQAGDSEAFGKFKQLHPRFLDPKYPWLSTNPSDAEVRAAGLDVGDAQLAVARSYNFQDWAALSEYVSAVTQDNSPVCLFETAVEAVIDGDASGLTALLRGHPELVRARSTRINNFDPPVHGATLLHYVAANGVEGYRQRVPANAVEVAKILLEAGAEVDALADMYGAKATPISMLVSSCHPAKAGLQIALAETLLDFGASIDDRSGGTPLSTALAFGYLGTAEALVRRGARVDDVAVAAGLGRVEDARRLLPEASAESRHRALALAAQHGHVEVVRLLLDAGEDPSRYNPQGNHPHSTPLHQAALVGHEAVVHLIVERGADLNIKDKIFKGTPLGWAIHGGQTTIEEYLRAHGAKTSAELDAG